VGEISAPVDSFWGVQILHRVEPVSRQPYAMASLWVRVDSEAPAGAAWSEGTAHEKARDLAATLRREGPGGLRSLPEWRGGEQWSLGHGFPELTKALDGLRFGESPLEPIRIPQFYVVPIRLDPTLAIPPDALPRYELPVRTEPDLEDLCRRATGLRVAIEQLLASGGLSGLQLPEPIHRVVTKELKDLADAADTSADGTVRKKAYRRFMRNAYRAMPEAFYARLYYGLQGYASSVLLAGPPKAGPAPSASAQSK